MTESGWDGHSPVEPLDQPSAHSLAPSLASAPQIDSIEIIELLGKGGMSLVYKARQKQLDRIVAVKVLSKSTIRGEEGIKRFQKEAKLTSALEHPNIVKTISFGISDDGQPYLVMEYIDGLSLAEDLKQNGRLPLRKFKDVFLPVLSALGQAHAGGLIHRDIKPGNIMICKSDTGESTVKLVDFGIAKVYSDGESETQNLTKSGALLGSPSYMSPEQCQGRSLDGRSDLYSMACVMFETLSGAPPFAGDSVLEVMHKHSMEAPPTVSELSRKIDIRRELAEVTLWGLAKDPSMRPQTAAEFAKKLNGVLERITLDKVPQLKGAKAGSGTAQMSRSRMLIAIFACLILAGIGVQQFLQKQKQDRDRKNQIKQQSYRAEILSPIKTQNQLESLSDKGRAYQAKGEYAKAEDCFKKVLEFREKQNRPNETEIAVSLINLGDCYTSQKNKKDKYILAEPLFKRSLQIMEKLHGKHHPALVSTLSRLDDFYRVQGQFEKSAPLSKRILEIRQLADP